MGAPPGFKFEPALPVTRGDVRFSIEFKDWDGDGNHMHSLAVFGWCVSKTGAARAIEFYLHGTPIASAQLHIERPDVVDLLGATDTPLICGFHLRFSKLTLPAGARLELQLWEAREGRGPSGSCSVPSPDYPADSWPHATGSGITRCRCSAWADQVRHT